MSPGLGQSDDLVRALPPEKGLGRMRYMAAYDWMETVRNTNQWLGATALAMGSYPQTGLAPHPLFQLLAAWGEVTERTFSRMVAKPDWGIRSVVGEDGRDHTVHIRKLVERPFGGAHLALCNQLYRVSTLFSLLLLLVEC